MVGLSVLTLVPGEMGGSETATRSLLRALATSGTLDYRVFVPPTAPDAGEGLPTEVAVEYRRAQSNRERASAMLAAAARPGALRRRLAPADVLHYPFTIAVPTMKRPTVVTLYDVQHRDLPHLFSRGERAFRAITYDRSARRADRVIVNSEFIRERAVEKLGLDADRVRVITFGIDHSRFSPGSEAREEFLLYPARPWPHKNHARLFEAFALLRRDRPELRLVLTGGGDFGETPTGVEIRGNVSFDDLVSLYRRAAALVFPSLYEGFGQPPLEAMACGCPVAASNAASLPEVCGDAARLFDPNDAEEIAAAVSEVLAAPEVWRERGLARAAEFDWTRTAADHEAVYRELSP